MEKLHLTSLILEMLGFGLAYIHVFRETLAHRATESATQLARKVSYGFWLGAGSAHYDQSIPFERRGPMNVAGKLVNLLAFASMFILYRLFKFGSGIGWTVLAIIAAVLLGLPVAIIVYVLFMLVSNGIVKVAQAAGRGNVVAGVGFFLGVAGMAIDSYVVWHSTWRWAELVLWGLFWLFAIWVVFGLRLQPQNGR